MTCPLPRQACPGMARTHRASSSGWCRKMPCLLKTKRPAEGATRPISHSVYDRVLQRRRPASAKVL